MDMEEAGPVSPTPAAKPIPRPLATITSMIPNRAFEHRASEVIAEVASLSVVSFIRDALADFDAGECDLGSFLDGIVTIGREAGSVRLRGWPFFDRSS
jgi:hypothetical protein